MHLDILAEVCDHHVFLHKDGLGTNRLLLADTLGALMREAQVKAHLGPMARRSCT